MKESTLATKVMIGVLCAGVLLYLAVYFVLSWQEELVTATAYAYTQNIGAEATGILVRDELVIQETGGYVDLVLSEGAKAAAGDTVALLYSDLSALDTRQSIKTLEAEIEQLQYALSSGTQSTDSSKLDALVVSSIVNLRALAASGDLSSLEDSALNLRTMVFKRDYTYGDTEAAIQINQLIIEKQDQLNALRQSLNAVSKTVSAPETGVFSGEVDGYESLITPDMLDSLSVSQLAGLLDRTVSSGSSAVGKLIVDSKWYLAVLMSQADADGLSLNRTYTISFSHDYYGNVEMTLERLETEGEQALAIFSSRTHLADTTLLRVQAVDIVTRQLEGIRVPRKALRVITETVTTTDQNTGAAATAEVNHYGVYTVVGTQAEWQEVVVLYTDDDFYLVAPVDETASSRLRAGDAVILDTADIYDGKVIQ